MSLTHGIIMRRDDNTPLLCPRHSDRDHYGRVFQDAGPFKMQHHLHHGVLVVGPCWSVAVAQGISKVFPSAYKIINGKNGEIPFNKFLNSYELIGSLILDDFGVFILECHNPPTDFTCFTGKPLSGGHLHGADRQLHVAGGISAFGSTGKGLSLCDLRWIYGWHWSRRDAQRPKKLYPFHFTRRRWAIPGVYPLYSTLSVYNSLIPVTDITSEVYRLHLNRIHIVDTKLLSWAFGCWGPAAICLEPDDSRLCQWLGYIAIGCNCHHEHCWVW